VITKRNAAIFVGDIRCYVCIAATTLLAGFHRFSQNRRLK